MEYKRSEFVYKSFDLRVITSLGFTFMDFCALSFINYTKIALVVQTLSSDLYKFQYQNCPQVS